MAPPGQYPFPVEVTRLCIEELNPYQPQDAETLKNCREVCQVFAKIASPLAFFTITRTGIRTDISPFQHIIEFMANRPYISSNVKTLYLRGIEISDTTLAEFWVEDEWMNMDLRTLHTITTIFPKLEHLFLKAFNWDHFPILSIPNFSPPPMLYILSLQAINIKESPTDKYNILAITTTNRSVDLRLISVTWPLAEQQLEFGHITATAIDPRRTLYRLCADQVDEWHLLHMCPLMNTSRLQLFDIDDWASEQLADVLPLIRDTLEQIVLMFDVAVPIPNIPVWDYFSFTDYPKLEMLTLGSHVYLPTEYVTFNYHNPDAIPIRYILQHLPDNTHINTIRIVLDCRKLTPTCASLVSQTLEDIGWGEIVEAARRCKGLKNVELRSIGNMMHRALRAQVIEMEDWVERFARLDGFDGTGGSGTEPVESADEGCRRSGPIQV